MIAKRVHDFFYVFLFTTRGRLMVCVFLFLLLLEHLHGSLRSRSFPWWPRFPLPPLASYASRVIFTTVSINAFITLHSRRREALTLPLLLSRVRKTWKAIAVGLFYITVVEKLISLLPATLSFMTSNLPVLIRSTLMNCLIEPSMLGIYAYRLYLDFLWTAALVFLASSHHEDREMKQGYSAEFFTAVRVADEITADRKAEAMIFSAVYTATALLFGYVEASEFAARGWGVWFVLALRCMGKLQVISTYTLIGSRCIERLFANRKEFEALAERLQT